MVDPIQSVKGKVVIDAFRLINPQTMMLGQEPRQTTSNLGHLNKPSIQVATAILPVLIFLSCGEYFIQDQGPSGIFCCFGCPVGVF